MKRGTNELDPGTGHTQGMNLLCLLAAKVGNGSHAFPTNLPRFAWYRSIPLQECLTYRNYQAGLIIFAPIRRRRQQISRTWISLSRAPSSPPTICITDISRARDLYVLRTTSSSILKLTDLPAGHKLTHDDATTRILDVPGYIYTGGCRQIYMHAYAGCGIPANNGEMFGLLTQQEELIWGGGKGTNASRGFTRRDLSSPSAASSRIISICSSKFDWPFYLLWKKGVPRLID